MRTVGVARDIGNAQRRHAAGQRDIDLLRPGALQKGGVIKMLIGHDPVIQKARADAAFYLSALLLIAFTQQDLSHLLDDLAVLAHLLILPRDADGADHGRIHHQRQVAALARPFILIIAKDGQLIQPLAYQPGRARVIAAHPLRVGAGQNEPLRVKKVQLLVKDAAQLIDDFLRHVP